MTAPKRATVYFEPGLHMTLRLKAAQAERSISDLVNTAVRRSLEQDAGATATDGARSDEPHRDLPASLEDLKLPADVAALLQQRQRSDGRSLRMVVSDALRLGLQQMNAPPARSTRYRTRSVDLGRCLVGDVDNVAGALAAAEGEHFR